MNFKLNKHYNIANFNMIEVAVSPALIQMWIGQNSFSLMSLKLIICLYNFWDHKLPTTCFNCLII